ncbi:hypothetical protein ACF0H5_024273 [Mactra antiquata]
MAKYLRKTTGTHCTEFMKNRDVTSTNIDKTNETRKWKPNAYIVFDKDERSKSMLPSRQKTTASNNINEWLRKDVPKRYTIPNDEVERYKKTKQRETEIRRDIMNIIQQKLPDVKENETKSHGAKRQRDNNKDDHDKCKIKRVITSNKSEVKVNDSKQEDFRVKVQNHRVAKSTKRKSADHDEESDAKRSKINFRLVAENTSISTTKEDHLNEVQTCSESCVCKVGPSSKPTPISRRGDKPEKPLYQKLLQRRLLNTVNMVFFECCNKKCCQEWSKNRIPANMLEKGFYKSDLRVDVFKWGQCKQKREVIDTDDDWFW